MSINIIAKLKFLCMTHQGRSVYVPPYACFVYGPTKCYFVHICVCCNMVTSGLSSVFSVLWRLDYFCSRWEIVFEVALLELLSIRCTLGFWATSPACWELFLQWENLTLWFIECTLGFWASSKWLKLREMITKELTI